MTSGHGATEPNKYDGINLYMKIFWLEEMKG